MISIKQAKVPILQNMWKCFTGIDKAHCSDCSLLFLYLTTSIYKMRGLLSSLLLTVVIGYIQVVNDQSSLVFPANSPALVFQATGQYLKATKAYGEFSLFTWAKFHSVPSSSVSWMKADDGQGTNILEVTKENTGEFRAILMCFDTAAPSPTLTSKTVSVPGSTVQGEWEHIAVCVSASKLSLQATTWGGPTPTPVYTSLINVSLIIWDPAVSSLYIGDFGSYGVRITQGQLLDTQFESYDYRTPADATVIFSSTTCHRNCNSLCNGPGDKECQSHTQFVSSVFSTPIPASGVIWNPVYPVITGTLYMFYFTYTGWFKESAPASTFNLFKMRDIHRGDECTLDRSSGDFLGSCEGQDSPLITVRVT